MLARRTHRDSTTRHLGAMATCFWAGDTFASTLRVRDDIPLRRFLQGPFFGRGRLSHMPSERRRVAKKIKIRQELRIYYPQLPPPPPPPPYHHRISDHPPL
ncbi:hypothetical protein BGY98DRAFT_970259, partial [Russula aff. rugulosa BPL654]